MKSLRAIRQFFFVVLTLCLLQLPSTAFADRIGDAASEIAAFQAELAQVEEAANATSILKSYCRPPDSPSKQPVSIALNALKNRLDQISREVHTIRRREIGTAINSPWFKGRDDRAFSKVTGTIAALGRAHRAVDTKRRALANADLRDCSPPPPEETDDGGDGSEEPEDPQYDPEPTMKEPVNVPNVPDGPLCEKDKRALVDAAFSEEHKANRNALYSANYIVALNNAGAYASDAPQVLKDLKTKWVKIAKHWKEIAIRAGQVRATIQGIAVKPCEPKTGGDGGTTGGGITTGGGGITGPAPGPGTGASGGSQGGGSAAPAAPNCPQCKPIADKLAKAKAEKQDLINNDNAKQAERLAAQADLDKAKKKVTNLLNQLDPERGTGAESTDTRTGERISSYDNGEGQVEIKRFDANGNQIGQTEYRTRPSTADKRKKLEDAQKVADTLQKEVDAIDKALAELGKKTQDKQKEINKLAKALADCIDKCKKALVSPPPATGITTGAGGIPASGSSGLPDDWVEQLERTTGRDLTEDEIKAYADNPEEVHRVLGTDDKPKSTKPKAPAKPKTPKVSVGDDIEIELEDARAVDGANALDPREIEKVGSGMEFEMEHIIMDQPSTSGDPIDTAGTVVVPPQPPVIGETKTSVPDQPVVTPPPPAPQFEFNPFIPLQPLVHIMFGTECPQGGPSMPVSARDGRPIKVEVVGSNQKFSTSVAKNNSASPVIESKFTCNVPGTGSFSEPVTVKMTDPKTGQSKTANYNLSVNVKQLQEKPNQ